MPISSLRTVVKQSNSGNTAFEKYLYRLLSHFIPYDDMSYRHAELVSASQQLYEILKTGSVRQNAVSLLFFKIQESFFKRIGINKGFYPI